MPGEDLQSWSTTAASNASADSSINWAEGMARASVNDSSRSEMAAHAKDRNLKNGSITTTGSANAQAFVSGVGYSAVPTGLRVMLKVGAGLTNTGSLTLNMDGIGPTFVTDQYDNQLLAGMWQGGNYVELLYDGNHWRLMFLPSAGFVQVSPQSGRLQAFSATAMTFIPYNGDKIKINGGLYSIPNAGVSCGNSGVIVNGVAGQNLAANTVYLVGLTVSGSSLVPWYSTTLSHGPSQTTGNVGIEVPGATNNAVTIIGMCRTDGSSQFQDTATARHILSWFNRFKKTCTNQVSFTTTSAYPTAQGTQVTFLGWFGDAVTINIIGAQIACLSGPAQTFSLGASMNAVNVAQPSMIYLATTGINGSCVSLGQFGCNDGLNTATFVTGTTGGSNFSAYVFIYADLWGLG